MAQTIFILTEHYPIYRIKTLGLYGGKAGPTSPMLTLDEATSSVQLLP